MTALAILVALGPLTGPAAVLTGARARQWPSIMLRQSVSDQRSTSSFALSLA